MDPFIRVTVKDQSNDLKSHLFQKGMVVIGKNTASDLQLNHPLVSRQHSIARINRDAVEYEDLQSTNGSLINGERITTKTLTQSDEVRVGPFTLKFDLVPNFQPLIAECYKKVISESPGDDFEAGVRENARRIVTELCGASENVEKIYPLLIEELLTYGPLDELLKDPSVTEVMVNGFGEIYFEKEGELILHSRQFSSEISLRNCMDRILIPTGRRLDEASPMVDSRLPDGSRINIIIPPISLNGPCLTIRKFSKEVASMGQLIALGSINQTEADFLKTAVQKKRNIVITGGTGTGKTTMLNALATFVSNNERLITIEDAAELKLNHPHLIRLESRPQNVEGKGEITIRQLVRNSLRMRPDRIIIGECRGPEALDMLQAMNTGHPGSLTTLHANTPADGLRRLETMILMAEMGLPLKAIREQISSALDLVVHLERNGTKRIVHSIAEVCHLEGEVIAMRTIYKFS